MAVSAKVIDESFDTKAIDLLTNQKIKSSLLPVIRKKEKFILGETKTTVMEYVKNLMILSNNETDFLHRFKKKEYIPELLFDNQEIVTRIKNHPMILWKIN